MKWDLRHGVVVISIVVACFVWPKWDRGYEAHNSDQDGIGRHILNGCELYINIPGALIIVRRFIENLFVAVVILIFFHKFTLKKGAWVIVSEQPLKHFVVKNDADFHLSGFTAVATFVQFCSLDLLCRSSISNELKEHTATR